MKQFLYKLILGIGMVLMTVFYTLLSVFQTPFRASQYRKSAFARETNADYEAGVTESLVFRLYNRLRQAKVPLEAIAHPRHSASAHLYWKDTLLIHEIDRVALREGRWVIGPGSPVWKEGLELQAAIAEVLEDVFDDRPGLQIANAVLLLRRSSIPEADRLEAELMPLFLIYDDEEDLFSLLQRFCS